MSTLFNGYLIVDWSANKTPKRGKDSIWWCHVIWTDGVLIVAEVQNPATRLEAFEQIRTILLHYKETQQRVLFGMDFSYGYPHGFAAKLVPGESPPWLAVWRYLYEHIEDSPNNTNNRFAVAAQLNHRVTATAAPFWGCPKHSVSHYLSMHKPQGKAGELFHEFRLAEQNNPTHSVWKLCYTGAVGGQTLMGLPYLYVLRTDSLLREVSRIWPFETGLKDLLETDLAGVNVLHAEIYPSLVKIVPQAEEIKDKQQVIALAQYLADLDQQQRLGALFAGGRELTAHERRIVETEEGWVLGM